MTFRMRKPNWDCFQWMTISIWTCCIIAMFALTVNDLIPLLEEYTDSDKNVATQVSIAKNKSTKPPTLVVCIPYSSGSLYKIWSEKFNPLGEGNSSSSNVTLDEYEAMKNHSWDVWHKLNYTDYDRMKVESASRIVKRVLDEGNGFPSLMLNESGFNWNQPIVDAVWLYLSEITRQDRDLLSPYSGQDTTTNSSSFNYTLIGSVTDEALDQLFARVLDAFMISGTGVKQDQSTSYNKSKSVPISIIEDELCIQNDPNRTAGAASTDGDSYEFYYVAPGMISGYPTVSDDPTYFYSSEFASPPLYQPDSTGDTQQIQVALVSLFYTVDSVLIENRTGKACSKEITPAMCLARSHVKVSMEYCHCIPFAYRFLEPNPARLPYCDAARYESCLGKLMEKKEETWKDCNEECEHTFYKWKQMPYVLKADDVTATIFTITAAPLHGTAYLEFTMVDKTTLQQFFSQLGGSIGLYLGFSGLTVAAVIMWCIGRIARRYTKQKAAESESNVDLGWGFLWARALMDVATTSVIGDQKGADGDASMKVHELMEEIDKLKSANGIMKEKIDKLSDENGVMKETVENLKGDNELMKEKMNEISKRLQTEAPL